MDLLSSLAIVVEQRGSDLLIAADAPPTARIGKDLSPLHSVPLTQKQAQEWTYSLLTPEQIEAFERDYELDCSLVLENLGRFRLNVHYQRGSVAAAIRYLHSHVPSLAELGLPGVVSAFCQKQHGLVLITGPAGSGKTTTLAGMIDQINRERACHIITIEDPIEYLHTNRRSLIEQREVSRDTHSFSHALRHVLRQSPDVILIGEMRDIESFRMAITAAETGHLVLASLHTIDACQTVDRILDTFPPTQQDQVRAQLAMCLQAVVSQTLLPRADDEGLVLAVEVLVRTSAVATAIRTQRTQQINSCIQTGRAHGMQTRDHAIKMLYEQGVITYETALSYMADEGYLTRSDGISGAD